MLQRLRDRLHSDDSGISLVELIIYVALSVVILLICTTLFMSSLSARTQVTSYNNASSVGSLVAASVSEGVRNAQGPLGSSGQQLIGIQAEPMTSTGQLLRARVAIGATNGIVTWRCQAWFYSVVTKSMYSANSTSGAIPDPVSFQVSNGVHTPTVGSTHWALVGTGLDLPTGASQFFSTQGPTVTLKFQVSANGRDLLLVPSTIVKHTIGASGTGPTVCF
jgi:hypothetical protein